MKQNLNNEAMPRIDEYLWAQGIERKNGALAILFIDNQNSTTYGTIEELAKAGLPFQSKTKRITTCFSTWVPACSTEYTKALKIPSKSSSHMIWEFTVNNRDFVVPALAIMRALYRPHSILLTKLFKPQGLDGICVPTANGLAFTKPWKTEAKREKTISLLDPIEWMWHYPSAKNMTNSLYQFALHGKLGMLLPLAKMRAIVYGKEVGEKFYVTKVSIATMEPKEAPFSFSNIEKHFFVFTGSYKSHKHEIKYIEEKHILPKQKNGDWRVSDAEWTALESHLQNDKATSIKYDRRTMLNGLLQKFCTGLSWRKCNYEVGTFVTASKQYLSWRRNGIWGEIEEVIQMRDKCPITFKKQTNIPSPIYVPLSNSEWDSIYKTLLENGGIVEFRNQNLRKYPHRDIVNEILARVVCGVPLRKDKYKSDGRNQSTVETLLKWRKNGILQKLIAAMIQIRPSTGILLNDK